jgi:anti-sigma-K factor RskA
MRIRGSEPHTLAGAYALDALSGTEKVRFERHLARCEACAQEIGSLHEAAARLAEATAATPPSALKERTLAAAARTRQLPPVNRDPMSWAIGRSARLQTGQGVTGWSASGGLRGWARGLAAVVVAIALVLAVILGLTARTTQHRLQTGQVDNREIAAVLSAPDATMLTARIVAGGAATVVMSSHEHALVFSATGLRAPPPARAYELWLIRDGADKSAGMLPASNRGTTGPVIATGVQAGDHLGLSTEPTHGSASPTSPMILEVTL